MIDNKSLFEAVEKNELGFYELLIQYRKQMQNFYKDEYYQNNCALYNSGKYDQFDIELKNNHYSMKIFVLNKYGEFSVSQKKRGDFLDIGTGEGYALDYFNKRNWNVTGIDYSSYGISMHNPSMIKYLKQGDLFKVLDELQHDGKKFDFINADNVLEHLPNPETFFEKIKTVSHKGTTICVTVPNDFSCIQKLAYAAEKIDCAFWVTKETSEHFSYFSVESLALLGEKYGFTKMIAISDWPIDFFLLNDMTNYIKNKNIGRDCHIACAKLENAICEKSMEKAVNLFSALAEAGIGREISIFFKL